MLNTKDDPIVSKDLIEYQAIKNENLILMVMERGLF
jgi:predicted alpha/beta-fold hydrolase